MNIENKQTLTSNKKNEIVDMIRKGYKKLKLKEQEEIKERENSDLKDEPLEKNKM